MCFFFLESGKDTKNKQPKETETFSDEALSWKYFIQTWLLTTLLSATQFILVLLLNLYVMIQASAF